MVEIKGGNKLERELLRMSIDAVKGKTLKVGFLSGANYPDGTPVATVAAIQDFGAPARNIPPRPFFRNTVKAGKQTWGADLASVMKKNKMDAAKALALMGEQIKGEIKNSIANGAYKPLKPATVKRKGFDKPLVDTGQMLNSVDYEVK